MRNFFQFIALLFCGILLASVSFSCGSREAFQVELETGGNGEKSLLYVNEKSFCAAEDIDALELTVTIEAEGGSGAFTIEDRDTGKLYWYIDIDENSPIAEDNVLLCSLKKESEYVMRLTGEDSDRLRAEVTSRDKRIRAQI